MDKKREWIEPGLFRGFNQAAMIKQCLERRIDSITSLENELVSWEKARNSLQKGVDWQFTTPDARVKLKRLYPQIKMLQGTSAI
jgi:hypothetical protein